MGFKTARRFFKLSQAMCDVNIQRGLGVCVEVRVICHVNFFKKRVHVNYSWELKFYFLFHAHDWTTKQLLYLTNREVLTVLCSVLKHRGSGLSTKEM